jgi:glycosyltransferase involved in cell wall biosynthesis
MPDSSPLVSVIIPAYNAAGFIRETVDSVLRQTWPNIEVIIIDDSSTDKTFETASELISDRVQVVRQKNSGACVARNRGLTMSRGKYIQFLDADDVLSSDKIGLQAELLEKNPGCLAVCNTVHFMNGQDYLRMEPADESFWIRDSDDPADFLVRLYGGDGRRWMVQTSAWLTPASITSVIGPWNEALLLDQDGEYFARAVLASSGLRTSGGINYYRRFSAGSNISAKANKPENLRSALLALNLKAGYLGARVKSERYLQAMATLYQEIAINAFPQFPDIVAECEAEVAKTGKRPDIPVLGGRIIELTSRILGWKSAKLLRRNIHSLLKR